MENKKTGYVCIFRSIKENWIWDDPVKLKWWLDILLSVNYSKEVQKVNINYELFECGRGQSVKTLNTWSKEWLVSKDTVRNFLRLLQKDNMISLENLKKSTRITVCNFDSYQTVLHDTSSKSKRKANDEQTPSDPNNKENKGNNENNENNPETEFINNVNTFSVKYPKEMLADFIRYWTEKNKNGKMKFELKDTFEISKRLVTWSKKDYNKVETQNNSGTKLEDFIPAN